MYCTEHRLEYSVVDGCALCKLQDAANKLDAKKKEIESARGKVNDGR